RFPYTPDRSYTPPDAPLEKYLKMLDTLGFARGALVQGSAQWPRQWRDARCAGAQPAAAARCRGSGCDDAGGGTSPLGCTRRARAALQSLLPRWQALLQRRRRARRRALARADDKGARLAHPALDRREGSLRDAAAHA